MWVKTKDAKAYYAHLQCVCALAGEAVTEGQVIARSGNTGKSTGSHLHMSTLVKNQRGVFAWVDPMTQFVRP